MSTVSELPAIADAIRLKARTDAGAATVLADRHAAGEFARALGLPAASYAVSFSAADSDPAGRSRVSAGWDAAERILVVLFGASGGGGLITILDRDDPRLGLTIAEPEFGLAGADEGWLVANPPLSPAEATHIPAAILDAALARHRLVAETLHLATLQGLLDSFLDQALAFLKARSRPWYGAGIEHATDDPHVLRSLGLLFSRRHALDELTLDAIAAVAKTLDQEVPLAGVHHLDLARHYAQRLARALVNEGIGLLGASSASGKHGFDRFWRDVAAHGLRHPPRKDAEALGRNFMIETRVAP
jgi:alkylation response protein AidB-like acyl-CoA dehydrogenase